MNAEETINYINSIISNPYLAIAIYKSINSTINNPHIKILNKTSVVDIFNVILNNSIRDIETHEKGKLFQRLIEFGPIITDAKNSTCQTPNTILSDLESISVVNFIYSHIINRFKGDIAEVLSIIPIIELFRELKNQNKISSTAFLCLGDYIKEYQKSGNLAKGADGLGIEKRPDNKIIIIGVIEIKSMPLSPNKIDSQITKHIKRFKRGLKLGDQIIPSRNVLFNSKNILRIMIIPSTWKVNRKFEWIEKNGFRKIKLPDPDIAHSEHIIEEIGRNTFKIILDWSKEAIEQAAYEMTFNYMSEVGRVVYRNKQVPKGWEYMSPEEIGYNAIKEQLYYLMLRKLTKNQLLKAVKLYNVYSFGYSLGIDSKEMLWLEDIK